MKTPAAEKLTCFAFWAEKVKLFGLFALYMSGLNCDIFNKAMFNYNKPSESKQLLYEQKPCEKILKCEKI